VETAMMTRVSDQLRTNLDCLDVFYVMLVNA